MKILVISPYPPSKDSNGIRSKMYSYEIALSHKDTQILILADKRGANDSESETPLDNLRVNRCWDKKLAKEEFVSLLHVKMDDFKPDIVHIHYNYLTFGSLLKTHSILKAILQFCSARDAKIIVTLHSIIEKPLKRVFLEMLYRSVRTPKVMERAIRYVFDRSLKTILIKSDVVITPSKSAYDFAIRYASNNKKAKIIYIPLGQYIVERYARQKDDNGKKTPLKILFVGAISPYKGVDVLIKSLYYLKNKDNIECDLNIVGRSVTRAKDDPRYEQNLRKLSAKLGIADHCHFITRYVENGEMLNLIEKADVVVYPLKDDGTLSTSASPYPAISLPVPVIVSDTARLRDFFDLPGVYKFHAGDPKSLSEAIKKATQDSFSFDERISQLEPHFATHVAMQYHDVYSKISRVHSGISDLGYFVHGGK